MPAARQSTNEKDRFFIAKLNIGAHFVAAIAAADIDRLEPGGFHIFKHQVFIIVLAIDDQLYLDQVPAFDGCQVVQGHPLIFFHLAIHHLAPGAGILDFLVDFVQAINRAVDFNLQAFAGDKILEGEIVQVGIEIYGTPAAFFEGQPVVSGGDITAFQNIGSSIAPLEHLSFAELIF